MFAIINVGGKQYKVQSGREYVVDHMPAKVGEKVNFNEVLLIHDDTKTTVGTPFIKNTVVTAKVVGQGKGEKIQVRRYKSKVRYRRSRGFRPLQTTIQILTIG
ncbi:50S ribosomal protein L21 [Candidatus Gottesmanbacteria bacterium]|nr:50S ribosomal protein L21 [Candidatus Gottesmanbacteria bacterium]